MVQEDFKTTILNKIINDFEYIEKRKPTTEEIISAINKLKEKIKIVEEFKPDQKILFHLVNENGPSPYIKTKHFIESIQHNMATDKPLVFDEEGRNTCIKKIIPLTSSKIFKIKDTQIVNMLLMTKNNIYCRKLPFNFMFIDNEITVNNLIIHGIFISAVHSDTSHQYKLDRDIPSEDRNIGYFVIGFDKNDDTIFYKNGFIEYNENYKDNSEISVINENGDIFNVEDLKNTELTLQTFVCNFLDFINNPEVEIIVVEHSEDQNEKRIARGKQPILSHSLVRVTGKLKIYIDQLEAGGHFKYSHRFWVRGHFRTLRDEERFGQKAGTKIWIVPYIKGSGILINKNYEVKKDD